MKVLDGFFNFILIIRDVWGHDGMVYSLLAGGFIAFCLCLLLVLPEMDKNLARVRYARNCSFLLPPILFIAWAAVVLLAVDWELVDGRYRLTSGDPRSFSFLLAALLYVSVYASCIPCLALAQYSIPTEGGEREPTSTTPVRHVEMPDTSRERRPIGGDDQVDGTSAGGGGGGAGD